MEDAITRKEVIPRLICFLSRFNFINTITYPISKSYTNIILFNQVYHFLKKYTMDYSRNMVKLNDEFKRWFHWRIAKIIMTSKII